MAGETPVAADSPGQVVIRRVMVVPGKEDSGDTPQAPTEGQLWPR